MKSSDTPRKKKLALGTVAPRDDALRFFYQQTPRPGASDTDDLPRVNAPKKLTITLNAEGSHPAHRNGLIDQYGYSAEGNSSMYRFSAE